MKGEGWSFYTPYGENNGSHTTEEVAHQGEHDFLTKEDLWIHPSSGLIKFGTEDSPFNRKVHVSNTIVADLHELCYAEKSFMPK